MPNRLIEIDYPGSGNRSEFLYDGAWQNTKITEVVSGSTLSNRQFIWCIDEKQPYKFSEERDNASALVKQFFSRGQTIGASKYFYATDRLQSVTEMTDISAALVAEYSYDPYGRSLSATETVPSDFGYAAYFFHRRSNLNHTLRRNYSSTFGRFISRDPLGEDTVLSVHFLVDPDSTESHGIPSPKLIGHLQENVQPAPMQRPNINLFSYVNNTPMLWTDPSGLAPNGPCPCGVAPNDSTHPDPVARRQAMQEWQNCMEKWQNPPNPMDVIVLGALAALILLILYILYKAGTRGMGPG